MKCFSIELRRKDPTPLEVRLRTFAFLIKNGEIVKLSGVTREFQESDIIDFEREIGSIAGFTYNDVVHGEASIRVEEIEPNTRAKVLKILEVEEQPLGRRTYYFIVLEVGESGEQVVVYSSHRSVKSAKEIQVLSRYLGVSDKDLRALLYKL